MEIEYRIDVVPDVQEIIQVYRSSSLNRPVDDVERIQKMYDNSNLVVTAWDGESLVGIARSLTDFSFCCYLSDLAVLEEYQHQGIGKKLIELTKKKIGEQCMLLLLSAPSAMGYYSKVGFTEVENGFIIHRVE